MKSFLAVFLFVFGFIGGIQKIYKINRYSAEAAQAYAQKKYPAAEQAYSYLIDSLQVQDDQLRLNLAHTLMLQQKSVQAKPHYQLLAQSKDNSLKSVAALQLGVIEARAENYMPALTFFKQALISNPDNAEARYNYELLKKYLEENPEKKQNQQQKQNQEQQDPDKKEQKDEENPEEEKQPKPEPSEDGEKEKESGEKEADSGESKKENEKQPDENKGSGKDKQNIDETGSEEEAKSGKEPGKEKGVSEEENPENETNKGRAGKENISEKDKQAQTHRERLQRMNISEDKANMILDAMRQSEQQYLQQLPKKSGKNQKQLDSNKPRW